MYTPHYLRRIRPIHHIQNGLKRMSTSTQQTRKEGDISSVFVSLSSKDGEQQTQLPEEFAHLKKRLIAGREDQIQRSWNRLLYQLREEVRTIQHHGSEVIPSIDYKDIHAAPRSFQDELRKRGVAVIRGVVPENEARGYKEEIEEYVRENPGTRGKFWS